jgi:hypothetical protein
VEFILSSNRVLAQRARQDISEREAHLKAVRKLYIKVRLHHSAELEPPQQLVLTLF